MVEAWRTESWGQLRSSELWRKTRNRFFTSKSDLYYSLKWLEKQGTVKRNKLSHKKVLYVLTEEYEDAQAVLENVFAQMKGWRATLDKLPKDAPESDVYRYLVPYIFGLLLEEWQGLSAIPRAKPQFIPFVFELFKMYTTEFVNQLQETGQRYPRPTNSTVRLIDGILIAVGLDLFQVLFGREVKVNEAALEKMEVARTDLIRFKGDRTPKLSILNL